VDSPNSREKQNDDPPFDRLSLTPLFLNGIHVFSVQAAIAHKMRKCRHPNVLEATTYAKQFAFRAMQTTTLNVQSSITANAPQGMNTWHSIVSIRSITWSEYNYIWGEPTISYLNIVQSSLYLIFHGARQNEISYAIYYFDDTFLRKSGSSKSNFLLKHSECTPFGPTGHRPNGVPCVIISSTTVVFSLSSGWSYLYNTQRLQDLPWNWFGHWGPDHDHY
jgi:hypothetical protein